MTISKQQLNNLSAHADCAAWNLAAAKHSHKRDIPYMQGQYDAWQIVSRILFPETMRINSLTDLIKPA